MKYKFNILIVVVVFTILVGSVLSINKDKDLTRGAHYNEEEYMLNIPYKKDFKILQLGDIHLGIKDNIEEHLRFIDLTIKDANPDLILMNGDTFTYANKNIAKRLFSFMDSHGVPWTMTFGNHDEQCFFSIDWLTDYLNNYGNNCVFKDLQDDNIFGNANFVINLMDGNTIHDQIIVMDSNRYNYSNPIGYDYLKPSQINWYKNIVNYTTKTNGLTNSLIFMHIPVQEYEVAFDLAQKDPSVLEYGEAGEGVSASKTNSGFFDVVKELGSTKAMFASHDHENNYRLLYEGIYLCYGVNSTNRIYRNEDMMGGHLITIHEDHTLSFDHIYHKYDEVSIHE